MKVKLKPDLCYLAGLTRQPIDKNAIGIETGVDELEERFVKMALKELKIEPSKILMREDGPKRIIYFYHSRIARQFAEIRRNEDKIFKVPNEFARNYLAGMFDSMGRVSGTGVYINGLMPIDEIMLSNLGVHTRGSRILNISSLLQLIKGYSTMAKGIEARSHQ